MAFIVEENTNTRCYLYAFHRIGRLSSAVNTLLADTTISKIHAIIEWKNDCWFIRDLSKNGTWLNHNKLVENQSYSLKVEDRVALAGKNQCVFVVGDLSPPRDLLIPEASRFNHKINNSKPLDAITLDPYHLLPDERKPELVLYYQTQKGHWRIEHISGHFQPRILNEHDLVWFANRQWKLHLNHIEQLTIPNVQAVYDIKKLLFIFYLSLDEEVTQLKLKACDKVFDFQIRSHHYLTLNLARHKAKDAKKNIDEYSRGWVYTEQLAKELGIDINYLNILIHRARKQFADSLDDIRGAECLIEREAGKLRFGGSLFEIYKGQTLECAVN